MMEGPIGFLLDRVLKVIPGINKIKADPEFIVKKLGFLGEGPVVGFILGILIGLLAGYDFGGILNLGVNLAAVMLLMPQMIGVMMQGLLPFSESVGEALKKRGVKREIYIGIDGCISSGYMPLLASTMIIIALTPFLAIILPGNRTLPMADLAVAWSWGVWSVAPSKGNLFRGILNHILITIGALYLATLAAPFITEAAKISGVDLGGMTQITAITAGGMLWTVLFIIPALFFTGRTEIFGFAPGAMMIFFVLFTIAYAAMWYVVRKDPRRIAATSLEDMRNGILNPDPLDAVAKAK
jgi:PTS system galactitol-specific IIC component